MTSTECSSDFSAGPILVLCGPEDPLTVVAAKAGKALASAVVDASGRAMPVLAPAVLGVLESAGLGAGDLGGVACVRGPGSFTGLRSILALGTGLALGAGIPMAGLDYLPVLARGASDISPGRVFAVTYSRRDQVYVQGFRTAPGEPASPLGGPMVQAVAQAAEHLARVMEEGPIAVVGSGAVAFRDKLRERLPEEAFLSDAYARPAPFALAACAAEIPAGNWSSRSPSPLYLRASDAEENLAAIAASRGLSPEGAARRFRDLTSHLPG